MPWRAVRLSVSVLEATAPSLDVGGLLNALQVLCLLRRSSPWRYLPRTFPTYYPLVTTHCLRLTLTMPQLLAISAAISGRVPVVPRVPCNSGWLGPGKMTLAGVADDYVLQLPGTEEGQVHCHLVRARVRLISTPTPVTLTLTPTLTPALTLTLTLTLTRCTATSHRGVQSVRFRRCCQHGTAPHCFQASPPKRHRLLERTLTLTRTASPDPNP